MSQLSDIALPCFTAVLLSLCDVANIASQHKIAPSTVIHFHCQMTWHMSIEEWVRTLQVEGPINDAAVAASLLWPGVPEAESLKYIQAEVLPQFAVRLPPIRSYAAATACRSALIAFAVMDPLRALLSAKDLLKVLPSI